MEFGIDENGNRVSIFDSNPDQKYYCPCCKSLLIPKRGAIKVHHFAHKSLGMCVEYYDNKGEWHRKMQDLFPAQNREVYNDEFGKHFFDVLTDNGTIIEFQNSPISLEAFWERTLAYFKYSLLHSEQKPIWVFNYVERNFYVFGYDDDRFRLRKLRWYHPTTIFEGYRKHESIFELWIRIAPLRTKPADAAFFARHPEYRPSDEELFGRQDVGYLEVKGIYDSKIVYGDVYTEKEFHKYLKTIALIKPSEGKQKRYQNNVN